MFVKIKPTVFPRSPHPLIYLFAYGIIDVMPEESKNAVYYQQQGFTVMPDGVALTIYNPDSPKV